MNKLRSRPSRNINCRRGQVVVGDRYVEVRNEDQFEMARHILNNNEDAKLASESPATQLEREMKRVTMRFDNMRINKVYAFRKWLIPLAYKNNEKIQQYLTTTTTSPTTLLNYVKRSRRYVAKSPERILDAPGLRDDFYSSLVDWSSKNLLAVGLKNEVYIWDVEKDVVEVLTDFQQEENLYPTMIKFSSDGEFLTIGLNNGSIRIYNVVERRLLRTIFSEIPENIACGSWTTQHGIISYGTKSGRIFHHDVRIRNSLIGKFEEHSQQVCGLKWSEDERFLTSGGADSIVNVWDSTQINSNKPKKLWTFNEHTAAVKAIEYVPFLSGIGGGNSIVATGGGTNDHYVRLWNLQTGKCHLQINTFSQITGIVFNKSYREMITAHGNPWPGIRVWRQNPINLEDFDYLADLRQPGARRYLGLCSNPEQEDILAIGEDETMLVWSPWKKAALTVYDVANQLSFEKEPHYNSKIR